MNNRTFDYWLLAIVLYSHFYLGNTDVFGMSLRVLGALTALVVVIRGGIIKNSVLIISFVIIICGELLSFIVNDSVFILNYIINHLISNILITLIFVLVTLRFYRENPKRTMLILYGILSVNTLAIIGQYFFGIYFYEITNLILAPSRFDHLDFDWTFSKHGILEGAVGEVYSGYLGVFLLPIAFYFLRNETGFFRFVHIIVFFSTLLSLLLLGQRSSFGIAVVITLYLNRGFLLDRWYIIFVLLIIVGQLFELLILSDAAEHRVQELTLFVDKSREETLLKATGFISENFVIGGGERNFLRINRYIGHNLVVNAFIRGGMISIIGVTIILWTYVRKLISMKDKRSLKKQLVIISLGLIANSFFHNAGLLSFEFLTILFLSISIKKPMNGCLEYL